jgi:hypothetical protein
MGGRTVVYYHHYLQFITVQNTVATRVEAFHSCFFFLRFVAYPRSERITMN